jgi:hypothetical protein
MMPQRFILPIALLLALTVTPAVPLSARLYAQPSLTLRLGGAFDAFRPVAAPTEARRNLSGRLSVDNVFAAERGRLFYDLDAGSFDSPGDWSYRLHELGASYRVAGADSGHRRLFVTGSLSGRRNGDAWTSADYTAAGAGFNVEVEPTNGATFRTGYRADVRRFSDLSALTQLEQRVFASVIANFQTRTTVIAEGQLGAKHYDGWVFTEVTPVAIDGAVTTTTVGRGWRAGMGPSVRGTYATTTASSERGTAGMASVMGRIAQSLSDRTGVRVEVTARRTFGSVPPMLVTTPAGFFEDGVYDDPFASDGLFIEGGITHAFASGAELGVTAWSAHKDYASAVALDTAGVALPGSPLRWDRVQLLSVMYRQPLLPARTGALNVAAEIGYRSLRHRSIDAYYNYNSHALSLGLSIGY